MCSSDLRLALDDVLMSLAKDLQSDPVMQERAMELQQRILENPLYQNVSGRFVQSHDYIAMERLYELHTEGKYDLIVFALTDSLVLTPTPANPEGAFHYRRPSPVH